MYNIYVLYLTHISLNFNFFIKIKVNSINYELSPNS